MIPLWVKQMFQDGTTTDPVDPGMQALVRSFAHLREWLSPKQRAQLDETGAFCVIGSHSGTVYEITSLRGSYNIVGPHGRRYCFIERGVPLGDVLLTQKIILEQDEPRALEIANVTDAPPPPAQEVVATAIVTTGTSWCVVA
jgi:hypothetical protein